MPESHMAGSLQNLAVEPGVSGCHCQQRLQFCSLSSEEPTEMLGIQQEVPTHCLHFKELVKIYHFQTNCFSEIDLIRR